MTKKTRTILFLIFLFLFLLVAPLAIFYSQGYRFDFEKKSLTQTGGLFLKVEPKQVEVYIDGKLVKKTDFFFGSALIENLLPRKYKIEIKKEGYFPWEKNLEIKEKEVIEAKNIVLFPENINFEILSKNVEKFWFSPDEKKIILLEKTEAGWSLKLYDLEKNVKSHLINENDVYAGGADLLNLGFSKNSKEISLEIGMKEQLKYFTLELDKVPPVLTEVKPPSPLQENIIAKQTFNGDLYYLDNFGNLFKNEERLTRESFPVKSETKYELKIFSNFIFLQENKILYLFNPESKSFEKLFEGINDLKISPDGKKLVFSSNFEIWLFFLSDEKEKKAGEKLFISRVSEKIGDIFWLNSQYLIFNAGNKIKITEIDDRDKINIIDFAEFNNPKIFWNQNYKKLYLLSENNLWVSGIIY
jgi:WD40 repeat protein